MGDRLGGGPQCGPPLLCLTAWKKTEHQNLQLAFALHKSYNLVTK